MIRRLNAALVDMCRMQVKTPDESKGDWDLAKIVGTIPGEQAFRPLVKK